MKEGVVMKKIYCTGILTFLVLLVCLPCPGSGQSSRCVILQKEGNRVLVSCNGGQTRYIDIRGRSDIYNVGDTIEDSDIDARSYKDRSDKQK